MVLDANVLEEKLIEAWKLRSNETSFSASLLPLVAECRSEEEFRTLFTKQILAHIDSATSSNLLQSYFKFHTRSGYVNEALVIERLLSLTPSPSSPANDIQIKFLLELLADTLKTLHVSADRAPRLGKQLNSLAKWLCSALCVYSNEKIDSIGREMLILISNTFLLLFTQPSYYCIWLMTIKAQKNQSEWRRLQEELAQVAQQMPEGEATRPAAYEQILAKINRLHLSEQFHQEEIEFNTTIFNPLVSMLVINQLHKSSSILLTTLRFFEYVSTMLTPSIVYLRLLQASFGGYVSAVSSGNSDYQHRWSAFVNFQLPRILASAIETQFDLVKQAIENFLLHNEYLLNRMDEMCMENVLEQMLHHTLYYAKIEVRELNEINIKDLFIIIQQTRGPYIQQLQQQFNQNPPTISRPLQILQMQRSLEKSLNKLLFSSTNSEDELRVLLGNLNEYIPLICALDQYRPLIRLLLGHTQTQFDLALLILCYVTLITDDTSEEYGQLDENEDTTSSSFIVGIWLKKYWLSRHLGHALFASSLDSVDLLTTMTNSLGDSTSLTKDEFLAEIKTTGDIQAKYSPIDYLTKTILLLGELPSLSFEETKQTVLSLIGYLTQVSYGTLVHVLLWLVANYQVANDDERPWIQTMIHSMGAVVDMQSPTASVLDAIKRQMWSEFIDNPLVSHFSLLAPISSASIAYNPPPSTPRTATTLMTTLFDNYITNEFLDSNQARALYVCSKYIPMDLLINRLLTHINTSNGVYETGRALYFVFGLLQFRRRASTRCLLQQSLPYLFNVKSNEFMLEPNVYAMCLLINILIALEFNSDEEQLGNLFRVRPWKQSSHPVEAMLFDTMSDEQQDETSPRYEDNSVAEAFQYFLNFSSEELFSSDNVRPVNYFLGWLQTILWMFSRTARPLKTFINAKLVAQLSEYLSLQFPVEKVLSVLDLSTEHELEYASMVITRDYSRLQTANTRTTTTLIQNTSLTSWNGDEDLAATSPVTITKAIFTIPINL